MIRFPGPVTRILLGALALTAQCALGARHIGFGTDAFNGAVPEGCARSAVFSPASFEVDCALFAESMDTLPKAGVSETMGIVIDFESAYRPVLEGLAAGTNGFRFAAARGFCVPDVRTALSAHRQFLEHAYGAEVMRLRPKEGAEAWFRAEMEGEMEDFALDDRGSRSGYAFHDLVSVRLCWRDAFPADGTKEGPFFVTPGETNVVSYMSDTRPADTWETKAFTLLRLPLAGDAWFYALLPKAGGSLASVRRELGADRIDNLLVVVKSVVEKGVDHGLCQIALPRMALRSHVDLAPVFARFKIPTGGLTRVAGALPARECVQHVRFRMDERGAPPSARVDERPETYAGAAAREPKAIAFDRPFVFFVHHEGTATIPVAGLFCGEQD